MIDTRSNPNKDLTIALQQDVPERVFETRKQLPFLKDPANKPGVW